MRPAMGCGTKDFLLAQQAIAALDARFGRKTEEFGAVIELESLKAARHEHELRGGYRSNQWHSNRGFIVGR